jgi:hypothetical protein
MIIPETQTFEGMDDRPESCTRKGCELGRKVSLSQRTRKRSSVGAIASIIMVSLMIAAGCAPEPSAPGTANLGGVWTANAHLFSFSQFKLTLVQEPNGIVSGGWSARGDGGAGGCAPGVPCDAFGNLIGVNTVSKVNLELLGAGSFEGVLMEPTRLRGAFSAPGGYDTITFIRTAK